MYGYVLVLAIVRVHARVLVAVGGLSQYGRPPDCSPPQVPLLSTPVSTATHAQIVRRFVLYPPSRDLAPAPVLRSPPAGKELL
jgi:hypothetical protein